MESEELEVGKQVQTIVNSGSGNRLPNLYTAWMSPLVKVIYSCLIHVED
jgi:hypothetical protein